jgi:hypothetical protein
MTEPYRPNPADVDWLMEQTTLLVTAAAAGDWPRCQDTINGVNARLGMDGVYAGLCGVARYIVGKRGLDRRPPCGHWGFKVVTTDGRSVNPDEIADQAGAGLMWATRFMISVANDDDDAAWALFESIEGEEQATHRVSALLSLANLYGRERNRG